MDQQRKHRPRTHRFTAPRCGARRGTPVLGVVEDSPAGSAGRGPPTSQQQTRGARTEPRSRHQCGAAGLFQRWVRTHSLMKNSLPACLLDTVSLSRETFINLRVENCKLSPVWVWLGDNRLQESPTCMISCTALQASSLLSATITPFPAARPLAFTTRAGKSALWRQVNPQHPHTHTTQKCKLLWDFVMMCSSNERKAEEITDHTDTILYFPVSSCSPFWL